MLSTHTCAADSRVEVLLPEKIIYSQAVSQEAAFMTLRNCIKVQHLALRLTGFESSFYVHSES